MEKDYGFGVISVEKELTNKEFLLKLYEADNKMKTNSLEGFEKLRQENKQLKERIQNILEGKEIPAICAKKYEEYEEQLAIREKEIRKQVCDEIRDKVSVSSGMISSYEELLNFRKIIDQIEQAEKELGVK